jgi:prepilin-type N-terminal cleavage/methylation domain-containing protein
MASDKMTGATNQVRFRHLPPATRHSSAFTLIEMLAVIAIIGVLAGLIFPVIGAVKRRQYINHTQAEMAQLETAIDRYKAAYGFYPPDNQQNPANPKVNQLYYELTGTTNITSDPNKPPVYQSLNDSSVPNLTGGAPGSDVTVAFGVSGFMNCSKPGGGEDVSVARNFLPGLRRNQVWKNFTNNNVPVTLLICSVGGPDAHYWPLGSPDLNPWRYNSSSPTNNPGSYDLWVQLSISGQTNLICNWTRQVQIGNTNLP